MPTTPKGWIGEGYLDLADDATTRTLDAWDGQGHDGGLATDGHGSESTFGMAARLDLM
jgi:hypothetical protein